MVCLHQQTPIRIRERFKKGLCRTGFPLRLEAWRNGKAFSGQGKVRNFEQTGKVREYHTEYWKSQGILSVRKSGNYVALYGGGHTAQIQRPMQITIGICTHFIGICIGHGLIFGRYVNIHIQGTSVISERKREGAKSIQNDTHILYCTRHTK